MTLKFFLLSCLLLCSVVDSNAQNIEGFYRKWEGLTVHPAEFMFALYDKERNNSDGIIFVTRGEYTKNIAGKSFSTYCIDRDSIDIDFKIKYKTERCKKFSMSYYSIGMESDVISSDTIDIPLSADWREYSHSVRIKRGFSLEVTIEALTSKETGTPGKIHIDSIDLLHNGMPLQRNVSPYTPAQVNDYSIQTWDKLLSSPIMDKRILALGETIYGTQSLDDISLELIKERVSNHNCKLIALEIPSSLGLYLNRYVKNDKRYTLDFYKTYIDGYINFSIIPLLEWVKDYNNSHNNEVTLVGVDEDNDPFIYKGCLYNYLESVNSDHSIDSLCHMALFLQDSILINTKAVNNVFSHEETELLKVCVENRIRMHSIYDYRIPQDKYMSQYFLKACDLYLDKNTTVTFIGQFIHANNVTVNLSTFKHDNSSMGSLIKRIYKNDYSCVALSVDKGKSMFKNEFGKPKLSDIAEAPANSIEYLLSQKSDSPVSFLPVADLNDMYNVRDSGTKWTLCPDLHFSYLTPSKFMDGVISVKNAKSTNKTLKDRYANESLLCEYCKEKMIMYKNKMK